MLCQKAIVSEGFVCHALERVGTPVPARNIRSKQSLRQDGGRRSSLPSVQLKNELQLAGFGKTACVALACEDNTQHSILVSVKPFRNLCQYLKGSYVVYTVTS